MQISYDFIVKFEIPLNGYIRCKNIVSWLMLIIVSQTIPKTWNAGARVKLIIQ